MRMRALQDRAVQHAVAVQIGDVLCAAVELLAGTGELDRREPREETFHHHPVQLPWMAHAVGADKSPDPVRVGFFRARTVVFDPQPAANPFQQSRLAPTPRFRIQWGPVAVFVGL